MRLYIEDKEKIFAVPERKELNINKPLEVLFLFFITTLFFVDEALTAIFCTHLQERYGPQPQDIKKLSVY